MGDRSVKGGGRGVLRAQRGGGTCTDGWQTCHGRHGLHHPRAVPRGQQAGPAGSWCPAPATPRGGAPGLA